MSITGTEANIPFLDLSRQHKELETELLTAVENVISRGRFVLGDEVSLFESEWSTYCGARGCAAVGNGTDAISLALLASGAISPNTGDEVITASISAGYSALAIIQAGAIPVFADVEPTTLLIDPESVAQLVTERTRAIVPVHLYGQRCDMAALRAIADRHGLMLIDDAAQAHGACRNGELSNATAFSFYPTKNLGACGDGGAVVSDDEQLIERVKMLRQGGHPVAMSQRLAGKNSRLDELQAAILRVKLGRLDVWNKRRALLADRYDELLESSDHTKSVHRIVGRAHANHLYVVRTTRRNDLRRFLQQRRIETAVHYPTPLHRQELFTSKGGRVEATSADAASQEIVSLPMNSHTTDWEVDATASAIRDFDRRVS